MKEAELARPVPVTTSPLVPVTTSPLVPVATSPLVPVAMSPLVPVATPPLVPVAVPSPREVVSLPEPAPVLPSVVPLPAPPVLLPSLALVVLVPWVSDPVVSAAVVPGPVVPGPVLEPVPPELSTLPVDALAELASPPLLEPVIDGSSVTSPVQAPVTHRDATAIARYQGAFMTMSRCASLRTSLRAGYHRAVSRGS